jgi:hypothetical protein
VNTSTPFESACTFENDVPYNETENGSVIGVRQSSHALPVSVVAAVNVPAPLVVEYPGLHVAVAVGVNVGVGEGVPVKVAVAVGVGPVVQVGNLNAPIRIRQFPPNNILACKPECTVIDRVDNHIRIIAPSISASL